MSEETTHEESPQEKLKKELLQQIFQKYGTANLSQQTYCEITGKSASTAEQDRLHGRGAHFCRMGRSVRYPIDSTVDFLLSLPRFRSTKEVVQHAA